MTIKELSPELRPRERLRTSGAGSRSTADLLALIISNGTRQATAALDVGAAVLGRFGSASGLATAAGEDLAAVPGVGETKAARDLAALEPGWRVLEPPSPRRVIRCAADAAALCAAMRILDREAFRAILLNTRHEVLDVADVSIGGLASAPVHPREVFKEAIRRSAVAVIVAHNHPSGHPEASRDDVLITEQLRAARRPGGDRSAGPHHHRRSGLRQSPRATAGISLAG